MHAFLKGGQKKAAGDTVSTSEKPSASPITSSKREHQKPWVEKYRPKTVEDVAFQDEVVNVLKKSLQGGDLPNLLFYGPPGTGKTSTILAAARELFGDILRERVLELNASDERGISVVRDKIKGFSQFTASATKPDGRPCPPFKLVILDEADSMTKDAQSALRRTMEKESRTTRFCLICNYVSRIIEPIASRCAKFRFKPLAADITEQRLQVICEKEQVDCSPEALNELQTCSEGDLRKAITTLQSCARLRQDENIRVEDVRDVVGQVPAELIELLVNTCRGGSYERLREEIQELMLSAFSAAQILNQLHDSLVTSDDLNDEQKSIIMEQMAKADKCLMDGADEYLQIMSLCTVIMRQLCHGA